MIFLIPGISRETRPKFPGRREIDFTPGLRTLVYINNFTQWMYISGLKHAEGRIFWWPIEGLHSVVEQFVVWAQDHWKASELEGELNKFKQ